MAKMTAGDARMMMQCMAGTLNQSITLALLKRDIEWIGGWTDVFGNVGGRSVKSGAGREEDGNSRRDEDGGVLGTGSLICVKCQKEKRWKRRQTW